MKERRCSPRGNECKLKRIPNTGAISNLHLDGNAITSLTRRRPAFVWMSFCGAYRRLSHAPKQASHDACFTGREKEMKYWRRVLKIFIKNTQPRIKNGKKKKMRRMEERAFGSVLSVIASLVLVQLISCQSSNWLVLTAKTERFECWSWFRDNSRWIQASPFFRSDGWFSFGLLA